MALGLAVVVALALGFLAGRATAPGVDVPGPAGGPGAAFTAAPAPSEAPDGSASAEPRGGVGQTDPESGLRWVDLAQLPPEASDTVAMIAAGPPFVHDEDGETFFNREGLLPSRERGYYREFTVETPGADDRGARRIVVGRGGEYYWTADHYDSFERIRR